MVQGNEVKPCEVHDSQDLEFIYKFIRAKKTSEAAKHVSILKVAADNNDEKAQYYLGVLLNQLGQVVDAIKYLEKAASKGVLKAMKLVAEIHHVRSCQPFITSKEGVKCKRNRLRWWHEAAKTGDVVSMCVYGILVPNGLEKIIWLCRAAFRGNLTAIYFIIDFLKGIKDDDSPIHPSVIGIDRSVDLDMWVSNKSMELLVWLARRKYQSALVDLANMYYTGKGVEENASEAKRLLDIALQCEMPGLSKTEKVKLLDHCDQIQRFIEDDYKRQSFIEDKLMEYYNGDGVEENGTDMKRLEELVFGYGKTISSMAQLRFDLRNVSSSIIMPSGINPLEMYADSFPESLPKWLIDAYMHALTVQMRNKCCNLERKGYYTYEGDNFPLGAIYSEYDVKIKKRLIEGLESSNQRIIAHAKDVEVNRTRELMNRRTERRVRIVKNFFLNPIICAIVGFLFWWWLEGFTKAALFGMLDQIKGISTGVSTNLTLSLIVSIVVAIVIVGWALIRGQRIKVILGALWRLVSSLFIGFIFWWWGEDFDMASLSGMLEQVKGVTGGISERFSLAMMVSGGTFVGLYMLKLLPWDEWIRIIPLVIGGVLASVLIVSGSWIVGVVIALTLLLHYFSAKEDDDLYWLKSIFLVIGLCLSAVVGEGGHWIVSIIISYLSLKWIDGLFE